MFGECLRWATGAWHEAGRPLLPPLLPRRLGTEGIRSTVWAFGTLHLLSSDSMSGRSCASTVDRAWTLTRLCAIYTAESVRYVRYVPRNPSLLVGDLDRGLDRATEARRAAATANFLSPAPLVVCRRPALCSDPRSGATQKPRLWSSDGQYVLQESPGRLLEHLLTIDLYLGPSSGFAEGAALHPRSVQAGRTKATNMKVLRAHL